MYNSLLNKKRPLDAAKIKIEISTKLWLSDLKII